ncbi:YajQ family cyclic di-GMP-binding protein [candidate division WOR-1 bacterium RIFOXYD2_FULL_36_8]|uniref:Nucleotide-binding protein A2290_08640 n=1 Tax=candidate division WOR-1 bacterium RIFOXYB2_FULL_36_35 TaxID=1802578 RepID=A0A1F4S2V7_UNCSA|nr:MAG: YajQ family cyclic di-GMP-binding protein [candidate division WOR-1 bacterium RIFOXYA2_FULL_36_21]OGC14748.1 MAG: YajQ family cyclic di-GMP-binding protein [candidate division WOR-1 bacterium RIFOXYB2_FULL_36_35]OGC15468.1 MAG: YajQ family cyclic di-GMP-binding protein [candidate division WOR-1 bacterium RIFOXYA12_FULL_36_13]OGC38032.1 MAG: YajQ family cyclic di-GMP-binding protein [candidate division WOR-1 bacterium RIFOXYD2_FULL_36_8]
MAQDHSFDITSNANLAEVDNAIQMSMKEILNRFDFKGTKSDIKRADTTITVISDDEFKLKNVIQILQNKLVKRGISLKFLDYGKTDQALQGTVRQEIKIKQGISQEQAKEINKLIKEMKLKIQSQIQGDQIRVSAGKIDDLQVVIQKLKQVNLNIELQFANYR